MTATEETIAFTSHYYGSIEKEVMLFHLIKDYFERTVKLNESKG